MNAATIAESMRAHAARLLAVADVLDPPLPKTRRRGRKPAPANGDPQAAFRARVEAIGVRPAERRRLKETNVAHHTSAGRRDGGKETIDTP